MSAHPPALINDSRAVLTEHARSFRWAGALLPAHQLDDAAVLYTFCRLVDDLVDEASCEREARSHLAALDAELQGQSDARPLVLATRDLLQRGPTGIAPALHLIEGVRSDLGAVRFERDACLIRYGYQVAGTVGLMMCAVLDVREPAASPFAVDLGVGMQITNICRDVREDAERGRVYLPAERLERAGVEPCRLIEAARGGPDLDPEERAALRAVVSELLDLADRYYGSASRGMRFIPLRARLAIHVASRVYRAIGHELRRRGCDPWPGRAHTSTQSKVRWSLVGLVDLIVHALSPSPTHQSELHLELRDLPGCGA